MKKTFIFIITTLFLVSCASTSGIKKYGESASNFSSPPELISHNYPMEDMYRIYKKGGSAFKAVEQVKSQLERSIADFAKKKGKSFVILGQRVVTNGFGKFPRVEIVFALTDKK
jgi:hypothetical protein